MHQTPLKLEWTRPVYKDGIYGLKYLPTVAIAFHSYSGANMIGKEA